LKETFNNNPQQSNSNLSSRKLSCELIWKTGFNDPLSCVFLSFDSKYAVTASKKGDISLLDAGTGAAINSQNLNTELICALMDSSTRDVFAFARNSIARIGASGGKLWQKNIQTPIIAGAVSQINKNFIICYEGNKIVIADYNAVPKYKGAIDSKGPITSIYAPEHSASFAVVTQAGDVYYMNANGGVIWQFCINDRLSSVSMSRDGKIIFAGSTDNKVLCLHGDQKVLFNFELKSPVICTDISEDGKYFAVGCSDGYIYVLDAGGRTIFYDKPADGVSKVFLTEGAAQILTLSGGDTVSMYKICERKTAEEKAQDIAGFIELGTAAEFKNGVESKNPKKDDFEKFIEL